VPDDLFEHPRLAALYDALDPDRSDLDPYLAMITEFAATDVVDLGCGTGVLALLISAQGTPVVGVDPAAASLDVARAKDGAAAVTWLHGDASVIPEHSADLVLMTGNAAQAVVDEDEWLTTLGHVAAGLRPGGRFVLETRIPKARGWEKWTEALTRSTTVIDGVGPVESWVTLTDVALPLVSFRWTFVFHSDGQVLTSDSTLRFREEAELRRQLHSAGFDIDDVRDAPDRPGREYVIVARRH
jgi:ubiquinone/menaquinone biosynthesis C-methylase UbiE